MAEETIRYRVEFDQAQVEGRLASLRNALGSSMSAAQYGGQIAAGGYSQLRSDLNNTFGNAFSPPSQQFTRGLQMGVLEAGVSAAGVAVPATVLSMGLLGTQATLTGIAHGTAAIAGGAIGAGSTIASAMPGMASMAMGGMKMMGAAALSPLSLKLAAAYYAGKTVMSAGETMIEDFGATDDIRDMLTAGGMRQGSAHTLAPGLISAGRGIGMGGAELAGVLESGISSGLIRPGGMSDPGQVGNKLIATAKQARNLQNVLQTSMSEAMNIMGGMGAAGIQVGDMTSVVMNAGAMGAVTGMGQGAMMQAGMMGAQAAGRVGLEASSGAGIAMSAVASAQSGMMALTPGLRGAVGGVQGMSNLMAQGQMTMINSQLGQAVGMATFGDPSAMAAFTRGDMSIGQAISAGARNLTAGGPQNIASNLFAMDDAKSRLSEQEIRSQNMASIMSLGTELGYDLSDKANMTMVTGSVLGLNMGTTAGRSQARAFYAGMTDPGVPMRKIEELQGRARVLAERGTTFGAAFERTFGWLGPDAVGKAIGREIREETSYMATRAGQEVDRLTTSIGRGARAMGRAIPILGGIARTEAQELYTINIPSSYRDPVVTDELSRLVEERHGISMREQAKGALSRAGISKTKKEEEGEGRANAIFAGADKALKTEGPAVSRLWTILGGDKGLRSKLSKQSRHEQLQTMADIAKGKDIEASPAALALVLRKRGVAAEANLGRTEMGRIAEKMSAEGIAEINELADAPLGPPPIMDLFGIRSGLHTISSMTGFGISDPDKALRYEVGSLIAAAGAGEEDRMSFADRAFAFLGADSEKSFAISETFKSKALLERLEKIKSGPNKGKVMDLLDASVSKAGVATAIAVAARSSQGALDASITNMVSGVNGEINIGGMQEGIDETFAKSTRATDRELRDSIQTIRKAIEAERMILQTMLRSPKLEDLLNTRGQ